MAKKAAITKVLSGALVFVILMSVMPVSVFAVNDGNDSTGNVSNRSNELENTFIVNNSAEVMIPLFNNNVTDNYRAWSEEDNRSGDCAPVPDADLPVIYLNDTQEGVLSSDSGNDTNIIILTDVSDGTRETVSALGCEVYVKIDDPCCVGYCVYVDGVYQFTEGQDGTPDGYCAFYVSAGTHTIKINKNGRSASKTNYFQCGNSYRWVSMPHCWCENGDHGDEVKFRGIVTDKAPEGMTGGYWWDVKVDEWISESIPCDIIKVRFLVIPDVPIGSYDLNIRIGDYVEAYGSVYPNECSVGLNGESYYIKKISSELLSINVWTDKSEYKIGETVTIYYQTNKKCTAKLTITKPDGGDIEYGPNEIPASTRSKSATAGYPTGKRTVVFEAWAGAEYKKATCYFDVVDEEECEVKFQGTVNSTYLEEPYFICEVRIDKIISDPDDCIEEGWIVDIVLEDSPCGSYEEVKKGNKIEVFGKRLLVYCWPPQISLCGKSSYYLKKVDSETLSISVWTDKSEYKIGETVTIYYQTNKKCTVKLTITKPDGGDVVYGPNEIPASTRSKSATAGYPTGKRTVVFEAWDGAEYKKATCYFEVVEEAKKVKIRGEILVDSPIISFYSFDVKIDEILDDPTGNLQKGETVNVYGHRSGPAQVDDVTVGDKVEVFGEYRGYVGTYEQIFLSDWGESSSDHYVKKIDKITSVHNIDTGKDFATIQAAINDPDTKDGHTIIVYGGIYYENVYLNKTLTLIGSGSPFGLLPTIDARGGNYAIEVVADNCVVKGFGCTNANAPHSYASGIVICSDMNTIKGNACENNSYGIFIYGSYNTISNNFITGNKFRGINLLDASDNTISHNAVYGYGYSYIGIGFYSSPRNCIFLNNFVNDEGTISPSSYESDSIWNTLSRVTYTHKGKTYINYLGNYWSDYTGEDADGDGIGDSSYVAIDGTSKVVDNYPLKEPSANYAIKANVKIRGTVLNILHPASLPPIYEVEIEEILEAPLGKVYIGDDAKISYPQDTSAEIDSGIKEGDFVEIYGGYYEDSYDISLDQAEHYLRILSIEPPVHNIDTGEDFLTIQAAINDPQTRALHTITVDPGTYNENVKLGEPVTIKSTSGNPENTIIIAKDPDDHVFAYEPSVRWMNLGVTIRGFTIKGGVSGIYLSDFTNHCNISNNKLLNNYHGIYLYNSANNKITSNNCSQNYRDGISLSYSSYNTILNNTCKDDFSGIYLEHSSHNEIITNTCENNQAGIRLWYNSGDNTIKNNNISNNGEGIDIGGLNEAYLNNFKNNACYVVEGGVIFNSPSPIAYIYNGNTFTDYLGNYWDDYKDKYPGAKEKGNTGIWDTPYEIDEDKDYYPLVEPFENYVEIKSLSFKSKGVYVWGFSEVILKDKDEQKRFFELCKEEGIKTVFLSINKDWLTDSLPWYNSSNYTEFIKEAREMEMQVHAMMGNWSWAKDESNAEPFIEAVLEYNLNKNSNCTFNGIHLDVEPEKYFDDISEFLKGYKDLLTGIKTKFSYSGETILSQDMALSIDVGGCDYWGKKPNDLKNLIGVPDLDYICIMAYKDNATNVTKLAECVVNDAQQNNKPFVISLETQEFKGILRDGNFKTDIPENRTFFEEGQYEFEQELEKLEDNYNKDNELFKGFAIHQYQSSFTPWHIITNVTWPSGEFNIGDSVNVSVKLRTSDNFNERPVGIGLSVRDKEGNVYPDDFLGLGLDKDTSKIILMGGKDEKEVELTWRVPEVAEEGWYDITVAAWDIDLNEDELHESILLKNYPEVTEIGMYDLYKMSVIGLREPCVELDREPLDGFWKEKQFKISTDVEYNPKVSVPASAPETISAYPGSKMSFIVRVENCGTSEDIITLSTIDEHNWDLLLSEDSLKLPAGNYTYISLNLTPRSSFHDRIKIYAKSTANPSKTSHCIVEYSPNSNPTFLVLSFNTTDELGIQAPDYVKVSKFTEEDEQKRVIMVFDPKDNESGIRSFQFTVMDKITEKQTKIPFRLPDCNVISTDFDISKNGYSFKNWGGIKYIRNLGIRGHCYGISETSILFFEKTYNVSDVASYATCTYEAENEDVEEVIKAHQSAPDLLSYIRLLLETVNEQEEYNKLKEGIKNGGPMMLLIKTSYISGHAVAAYKIVEVGNNAFIICYDNEHLYNTSYSNFGHSFAYAKLDMTAWKLYFNHAGPLTFVVSRAEPLSKYTQIKIECPVNTTITDQYGRIIADNGTNEIPDADMIITNETKIFYLPADLTYSTEIDAYDTGTFNFTRVSPIGKDISITKFENIPVTSNTKASVEIVPDVTDYIMSIDYDGDGVYEKNIAPDVNDTIEVGQDLYPTQLHSGWNLISLPLTPKDTNILNVMSSVADNWNSVWSYEGGKWQRYDLTGPDFLNTLTFMEPGKGYWLHMKSDDTLSISGSEPRVKSIPLSAGWNLVGYNSLNSMPTAEAMSSVEGNWNSVWSYEGGKWKRYDLTGPDFLNTLTFMEPGKGYWLNMKSPDTWTLGA